MFNLFGKIGSEYKDEGLLKEYWGELTFYGLQECIRTRKRDLTAAEILADNILEALEKNSYFQSFIRLILAENTKLIEDLRFDMKFLMIASGYYERLNNAPAFSSTTNYYKCLNPRFTFRVKRKDIHKNNNNQYPLKQFILTPQAHNLERLSNFLDLGLIIGLMDSYDGGVNPYIHPQKPRIFKPFDFLQKFKYAYIDESDVKTLLTKNVKNLPHEKTDYGKSYRIPDREISAQAESLENTINPQIYSVLNQFFIERLTNLNFIISSYDYKENYKDKASSFVITEQLSSLLSLPLPNFRLAVLNALKEPGSNLSLYSLAGSVRLLEEHLIPLICGTYLTLAESNSFHINKDEHFLKELYANPRKNKHTGKNACQFFKLHNDGQICPVEEFHLHNKNRLTIPELNELDRKYFDNSINAANTNSFKTILDSIILPAYKDASSKLLTKRKIEQLDTDCTKFNTYYGNLINAMGYVIPPTEEYFSKREDFIKLCCKEADKTKAKSKICADIQDFIERLGGYAVPGTDNILINDLKRFMKFSCDLNYFLEHSGQSMDFSSYAKSLIVAFDEKTLASFWENPGDSFLKDRATAFDELVDNIKRLKGYAIQNSKIYDILTRAYANCHEELTQHK